MHLSGLRWMAALPLLLVGMGRADAPVVITPLRATEAVSTDPDDPAVWVHPTDPARSLILGTNKTAAPDGALVVFRLDGKTRQTIAGLDRPNNVDVEYGLSVGGKPVDIAVVTERRQTRLRVFAIAPDGSGLTDISSLEGLKVFVGEQGEKAAPMGIALYKRPSDGAIFAIVSRKEGPQEGYLHQYRLRDDGSGKVKAEKVRAFGRFCGTGEIEAVAVDDQLGYVYYADEESGIHKYHADPDHPQAQQELAVFGQQGFSRQREGIALYTRTDGTGYLVCTDQIDGGSVYRIYRREGEPNRPHDHSRMLKAVQGGADSTDGIEVVSTPLGAEFPDGLLVAMNSGPKNFLLFRWHDVAQTGEPKLKP